MIGGLLDGLLDAGIPQEQIIGIPQGYKLAGYLQTLERKLAGRELWHQGLGLMTWVVGNARIVMKGNGIMVSKQESGVAKIDPLIAALNATALMSMNPEPAQKEYSVFRVGCCLWYNYYTNKAQKTAILMGF